ncbi:MAG: acetyl-CoA carboxylase biotin carboxyl carrier protein [Candidatus Latescibacteria bacterium]|nr:acetyl-CoA carboxylase biotin carboxyl carrier protein [bacterium]MBD3424108.1 acetyl-CoA carboxylase biotin carboxyl carrier protein [Candidatus Latescibacterota bacterium]
MNKRKIKELISILKEEKLDEIEWSGLFTRLRVVKRSVQAGEAPAREPAEPEPESAGVTPVPAPEVEKVPESGSAPEPEEDSFEKIVSPMVGTFYRSPNPEEPPYVKEGKRISEGDVVCIIEAMKLMNEIEAETGGIIRDVLVENSQPVEYGQPLFSIETD